MNDLATPRLWLQNEEYKNVQTCDESRRIDHINVIDYKVNVMLGQVLSSMICVWLIT